MRKYLIIFFILFLSFLIFKFIDTDSKSVSKNIYNYNQQILIKDQNLWVEIADTEEKRRQGLSNRENLKQNQGMLFIFNPPQEVNFWMKDMNFPIDMIFVKDNKIVDIKHNVPVPDKNISNTNLPTYSPNQEIDMVLETNANWCKQNNINIGDEIKL